ncbi:glycosyltransferase [Geomonas sp.]|uniref:glycosyltransferase n=1 Tax=Geomonas sp. TaxID=2651584 RepID=UPI002B48C491|nr:glycosyltransferase [Geomonas sp.]HJV34345.1 glycosyltransferase [Geomonas sp.]
MTNAIMIDVVIPVWNRPKDTRNCLVNLINNTPDARLIMFDIGSDRETEKMLQEFADGLEERALLIRDDSNIGFVKAANRGLLRCDAPFMALVRNTTEVPEGWFKPLLEFAHDHPEAGIMIPCLSKAAGEAADPAPSEVVAASFSAMVITRKAFKEIGGLDEGMDGGQWCLRDYTRRACAKGYLTYRVAGPVVGYQEEKPLGSVRRRAETLEHSRALFSERWGEGGDYVVHVPKGCVVEHLREKLGVLVKGARHGDSFQVLLPALLHKAAEQEDLGILHDSIKLVPLPRFALGATRRHLFERMIAERPGSIAVTAVDGIAFPWGSSYLSFTELTERIESRSKER